MTKKGVSPLIAAVLIIAITVAIATLVTGWISSLTRGTQATVSNKTTEATNCAAASIVIDDVYVQDLGTTSTVNIVVRNSGGSDDMVIQNVTVFNSSGGGNWISSTYTDFDRGEVNTFTITSANIPSCPTDFSEVIATTDCGGVSAKFDSTPLCS